MSSLSFAAAIGRTSRLSKVEVVIRMLVVMHQGHMLRSLPRSWPNKEMHAAARPRQICGLVPHMALLTG